MKRVAFCTLGCKVNQYETDAMEELFAAAGYEICSFKEQADIYIINTCTVTNMADRKSRQMLHRARKLNPKAVIAAVGCYVQAAGEKLLDDPDIDIIVGNNRKAQIVELVEAALPSAAIIDINHTNEYETMHVSHVCEHTRAYIKIQDGCNQFCSYCIIPFARGRVRSREAADIVAEVRTLVTNGYKEIVLTGIHISSYGMDFDHVEYNNAAGISEAGAGKSHRKNAMDGGRLLELIEALAAIDGLLRIRLGSLEPRIVTEAFVKRLSAVDKLCSHFHLSLQSGCDATLSRMNRKYTAAQYDQCCQLLRKYFETPAITTDVIVGFPGETEEEFEASAAFLEHIGFAEMHVFKYSKRAGTKAAGMKDQVSETVKAARSTRLIALGEQMREAYARQFVGRQVEVLLEEPQRLDGKTYMTGYTKEYLRAGFLGNADEMPVNTVVAGTIAAAQKDAFVLCERDS